MKLTFAVQSRLFIYPLRQPLFAGANVENVQNIDRDNIVVFDGQQRTEEKKADGFSLSGQ